MTQRVAITGCTGRMGRNLLQSVITHPELDLVAGLDRKDAACMGQDLGHLIGRDPIGVALTDHLPSAIADADILIDFTHPDLISNSMVDLRASRLKALIIGTTGFSEEAQTRILDLSKYISVVKSGNFGLGITLLAGVVQQLASKLGKGWDIEISETHHRHKTDAPSGTAFMLGEAAAKGRGKDLNTLRAEPYIDIARKEGKIGFSVRRMGGVIGEHSVSFGTEREYIELSHKALDRAVFADGAVDAAIWAVNQPPGYYTLRDMLEI